jgi:predicted small secreted protein
MPRRCSRPVAAPVLAVLALGMVASCSTVTSGKPAEGGTKVVATSTPLAGCGTTRTAAGVPVEIEIVHGQVACPAALTVERDYARALASGQVPGNGGGAPVKVRGWVCQGFATPQVLATGHTSACKKGAAQILAVLKMPASPTPSS